MKNQWTDRAAFFATRGTDQQNIDYVDKGDMEKSDWDAYKLAKRNPVDHPDYGRNRGELYEFGCLSSLGGPAVRTISTTVDDYGNTWTHWAEKPKDQELNYVAIHEIVDKHDEWGQLLRDPAIQNHAAKSMSSLGS